MFILVYVASSFILKLALEIVGVCLLAVGKGDELPIKNNDRPSRSVRPAHGRISLKIRSASMKTSAALIPSVPTLINMEAGISRSPFSHWAT
jgi:hypothetical protein